MRPPPEVPVALSVLLRRQDGAVTNAQARAAGLTETQIRTLVGHGWTRPVRGVLLAPDPPEPFRASLRAALLACPDAVACGVSAARLYQLAGLPKWTPAERSHLLLPAGRTYEARAGIRLQSGLHPGEVTRRAGFPLTTLDATVASIPALLSLDDLICLLDSALAAGWLPVPSSQKGQRKLRKALALADKRAESTFETLLRLLLVRAGVPPETLQFQVLSEGGRKIARLDLAWPSLKLAVEADGREHHDAPKALYRDRARANALELEGWTILRFTWSDLVSRPEWIVAQISLARNRLFAAKTAA